jgi:hypothetical protein
MMARDLARVLDPALLAIDAGLTPDLWQSDLLRGHPSRSLLLCSRQSGKSTVAGLMGLHEALYHSASLVLIVSPSQRQSAEMFRTILGFYHQLTGVPELAAESVLRAEFKNGSRIVALPGTEKTIRGYSAANLIIIDEAARVEDELIAAVRPMLATSEGRLVALTTPAGKRGWFFDSWMNGDDTWHRVRVTADECPRISKEFLAEELKELGAQRFSEEYGLEFLDPDESVFPTAIIDAAFTPEVVPLWL